MVEDGANTATLEDLIEAMDAGRTITGGSSLHRAMHAQSQRALRITAELNGSYHEEERVSELLSELVGEAVGEGTKVFPPFYSDFGRNIHLGRDVFINMGCKFQDQGGITIGDRALIGHNVVIATLNHSMDPARRADMEPHQVSIGADAWIGANATILPGVRIGDGAVIAAASVVTRDVPDGMLAVGSPAKVVREAFSA